MPIPLEFYDDYYHELPRPAAVEERLCTFLDLVTTNPDDPGFLATCEVYKEEGIRKRIYAYHLTQNYIIYWRVIREKFGWMDLITLKELHPILIQIINIRRP
jgi:hypothetical protein